MVCELNVVMLPLLQQQTRDRQAVTSVFKIDHDCWNQSGNVKHPSVSFTPLHPFLIRDFATSPL